MSENETIKSETVSNEKVKAVHESTSITAEADSHVEESGNGDGNQNNAAREAAASEAGTETGPNGVVEEKKMTIEDLQGEINKSITKLKTKLEDASQNIDFQNGDINAICTTLSGLNLLGEFDKELYSSLNKYFDKSYDTIQVDGIDLRVRGSLSQLMYSKIINGKVNNKEWPSEAQKEIFKKSLEGPSMFSMGSLFGSPSKNPTASSTETKAEDEGGEGKGGPPGAETVTNPGRVVTEDVDQDKGGEGEDGNGNGDPTGPPKAEGEEVQGGGKRIIKRKRKFLKKK